MSIWFKIVTNVELGVTNISNYPSQATCQPEVQLYQSRKSMSINVFNCDLSCVVDLVEYISRLALYNDCNASTYPAIRNCNAGDIKI
jgi:hypothetical protein